MSLGKKRKRRQSESDIDTSSLSQRQRSASADSTDSLRQKRASKLNKTDAESDANERRESRSSRLTATAGQRKRSKSVPNRSTRDDASGVSQAGLNKQVQSRTDAAQTQGRKRSAAIGSDSDSRAPGRDVKARPFEQAKDGTELWDGSTIPELSQSVVKDVLKKQTPKYDLGKGRMVYPVENPEGGEPLYLPLPEDATDLEKSKGIFVSIVPEKSLAEFVKEKLEAKRYEVDGGAIEAISVEEIKKAFEAEPKLILRAQHQLDAQARQNEVLQQKWVE